MTYEKLLKRESGEMVKIVVQNFASPFNKEFDYFVLARESNNDKWVLCKKDPPIIEWNGVTDYLEKGRSETLQKVTFAEVLSTINEALLSWGH